MKLKLLLLLLTSLTSIGGYVYYTFEIKEYDTEDTKVDEVLETDFDIDLPILDSEVSISSDPRNPEKLVVPTFVMEEIEEEQVVVIEDKPNDSQASPPKQQQEKKKEPVKKEPVKKDPVEEEPVIEEPVKEDPPPPPPPAIPTVAEIKEKYTPSFFHLEEQANARLQDLLNLALQEYKQQKQEKQVISYAYFYNKYIAAGRALESKTDETFYMIYALLEKELQKNGYPSSEANDIKENYENKKVVRQKEIIRKALQMF